MWCMLEVAGKGLEKSWKRAVLDFSFVLFLILARLWILGVFWVVDCGF